MLSKTKTQPHHPSAVSAPMQVSLEIVPTHKLEPVADELKTQPTSLMQPSTKSLTHTTKPHTKHANPTPPTIMAKQDAQIADAILPPPSPVPEKKLASMPAPPAPTQEEWQLASTYTLKNSKRYRYTWGQQVRSMMGTAVEGPQQGQVRLHIEIAPDGKIAKVEVLWTTSETAEKLVLQAIKSLPPLPPTPTGKPLIFDKTISFEPVEMGWPPIYKYDCLPDPPTFHNPFAWDGSSTQPATQNHADTGTPVAGAHPQTECPPGTTSDSIEAEEKDMKRQFDQWGSGQLNGVK